MQATASQSHQNDRNLFLKEFFCSKFSGFAITKNGTFPNVLFKYFVYTLGKSVLRNDCFLDFVSLNHNVCVHWFVFYVINFIETELFWLINTPLKHSLHDLTTFTSRSIRPEKRCLQKLRKIHREETLAHVYFFTEHPRTTASVGPPKDSSDPLR